MPLKQLLGSQKFKLALLIGNGINRYGIRAPMNSWSDLLIALAQKHIDPSSSAIPPGVSLTEFYDSLELAQSSTSTSGSLQQEFCAPMQNWIPDTHHEAITKWAIEAQCPILTTNFDEVLSRAADAQLYSLPGMPFTDFYPWNKYFGLKQLHHPDEGFGIWHINGTIRYRRSIRLGLTHYMGSVERARTWLHRGDESSLFRGKNIGGWAGHRTWLHTIFNKPLLILGLSLEENEVFLRWLLIERAKYFKKFPDRRQESWFAHVGDESPGKQYFFKSVGIKLLQVHSYDELYGNGVWA
ncbi:SIR2 family protein [Quatrionicoccus australiensis]|uniref:SIR2 family protein n=1 Tax=Quatrionicoccus australiensis TaxID=138118 RepID=UPI001CF900AB|nr:SIR2 family protein [Quatrionicoccus australiensis]UCV13499.1 SIR2 family protein [Quatrionicoccus australiensis]